MPMVTDREILELKNKVSEARDNVIKANATMQEVEKNMLSCVKELEALGIPVEYPSTHDPAEWSEFYSKVMAATTEAIEKMEASIAEQVGVIRTRIASWVK